MNRSSLSCVAWVQHLRVPLVLGALMLLVACAGPLHKAPVEERGVPRGAAASAGTPATVQPPAGVGDAAKGSLAQDNAGKAGYYVVKPGDTMIRIGLETGQNWRDIARWNAIDNPNVLEVGQVLRVVPPGVDAGAPATRGIVTGRVDPRPLDARPAAVAASAVGPLAPASAAAPSRDSDDDVSWAWPSGSTVAVPFDETRTKGLVFTGKAGDPVLAAADGRVVYAGSGLRGYGNLVIVKHNNTFLSAYAHNQTLLVKEDQVVRRGQKIAEMGASDAERVQLHFEIRRLGKPIDPARLLPPR